MAATDVTKDQSQSQSKSKNIGKKFWDYLFENAAPTERHLDVAYVPLQRDENGKKVDVGVFVVELYMVAKAGFLPVQVKARNLIGKDTDKYTQEDKDRLKKEKPVYYSALFHSNGVAKTHFELAVLSSYERSYIQATMNRTYSWMRKNGYELSPIVSKIRAVDDYLANLSKAGLSVKNDGQHVNGKSGYEPTSGTYCFGGQSVRVSIDNFPHLQTNREKALHYAGSWLALLLTVSAAVAISGISTPLSLALFFIGTYRYMKCGSDFDMFDKAESLYRDIGWIFTKEYWKNYKFNLKNTLSALIDFASLGLGAYLAATGAWAGIMGLPFLQWAPQVEMAIAGFFATVAAIGSFVAFSGAIRYIRGLSPFDNQIDVPGKDIGARLKVVTKESEKAIRKAIKYADLAKGSDAKDANESLLQDLELAANARGCHVQDLLSQKGKEILNLKTLTPTAADNAANDDELKTQTKTTPRSGRRNTAS